MIYDPTKWYYDPRNPHIPLRPEDIRKLSFEDVHISPTIYHAQAGSMRCLDCGVDQCSEGPSRKYPSRHATGCSFGTDIRGLHRIWQNIDPEKLSKLELFITENPGKEIPNNLIEVRRLIEQAYDLVVKTNPFPEFFLACPAPCQKGCVTAIGENVDGEHFAVGTQRAESVTARMGWLLDLPKKILRQCRNNTDKKVIIFGSGPAGLYAGFALRMAGHQVVIHDRQNKPGGLLNQIPNFHIPKELVERRIKLLEELEIEFKCNSTLGKDVSLEQASKEADAVILALGTEVPRAHPSLSEGTPGVIHAMEFLSNFDSISDEKLKKGVYAIGAGFTVLDVLGTSYRLFNQKFQDESECKIKTLVRRPEPTDTDLKWSPHWNADHPLSGIAKYDEVPGPPSYGTNLLQVMPDEEGIKLKLQSDKEEKEISAGSLVLALGFLGPNLDGINIPENWKINYGRNKEEWIINRPSVDPQLENVYVCGDSRLGPRTIVQAGADGLKLAREIQASLQPRVSLSPILSKVI